MLLPKFDPGSGLAGGINSCGLKFFSPALRPLIFSDYGIVFHGVKAVGT